jgi:hypothetical protein
MGEFDSRPDAEIRFVAEGEEVERLQARLRRGATPLAGSAVLGLGPELHPFFWAAPSGSAAVRELLAFQDRHGECDVAVGWDVALPTRLESPEGVVRMGVQLRKRGETAEAAFYLDIRRDPRTGRLRFLRTLPFVLELHRLALYPTRPTDFAREEGIAIALDPDNPAAVKAVVDAYEKLGLM